jgi:hypothetical protein
LLKSTSECTRERSLPFFGPGYARETFVATVPQQSYATQKQAKANALRRHRGDGHKSEEFTLNGLPA